jgi:hypothetical protein
MSVMLWERVRIVDVSAVLAGLSVYEQRAGVVFDPEWSSLLAIPRDELSYTTRTAKCALRQLGLPTLRVLYNRHWCSAGWSFAFGSLRQMKTVRFPVDVDVYIEDGAYRSGK